MSWLFEDPTLLLIAGAFIEAALAVGLFLTGRGSIVLWMIGVAALVAIGWLVERLVVTEVERIQDTFAAAELAGEANDAEAVIKLVDNSSRPAAEQLKSWIRARMGQITVQTVSIYALNITVDESATPPTAKARFRLHVVGKDNAGQIPYTNYSAIFTVSLEKQGDAWRFTAYEIEE